MVTKRTPESKQLHAGGTEMTETNLKTIENEDVKVTYEPESSDTEDEYDYDAGNEKGRTPASHETLKKRETYASMSSRSNTQRRASEFSGRNRAGTRGQDGLTWCNSEKDAWAVLVEPKKFKYYTNEAQPGFCSTVPDFNPYIKVQNLKTGQSFETLPVYGVEDNCKWTQNQNCGSSFRIPDDMDLQDVNFRFSVWNEIAGMDYLIVQYPMAITNLKHNIAKKRYTELELKTDDGAFLGWLQIRWRYDPKNPEDPAEDRIGGNIEVEILGGTQLKNQEPDSHDQDRMGLYCLVGFLIYTFVGAALIHVIERDDCPNFDIYSMCWWFTIVTLTTVGYGDMYPCSPEGQVFNGFMIILNIALVSFLLTTATAFIVDYTARIAGKVRPVVSDDNKYEIGASVLAQDQFGNYRLARVVGVKSEEARVGKGTMTVYIYDIRWESDNQETRVSEDMMEADDLLTVGQLESEFYWTLGQYLVGLAVLIVAGTIIIYYVEKDAYKENNDVDLDMANSFHITVVTLSTVGYGDWAPYTTAGKVVLFFYIIFGIAFLGNLAGLIIDHIGNRKDLKDSEEFLKNSLVSPEQILEFDSNGDEKIDRYEYLAKSLVSCKMVTEQKIRLIMSKFNDIDTDNSGEIDLNDFKAYADKQNIKRKSILAGIPIGIKFSSSEDESESEEAKGNRNRQLSNNTEANRQYDAEEDNDEATFTPEVELKL